MNISSEDTNTLRVLIIGDCKIGKTCLLLKYLLNNNNNVNSSSSDTDSNSNDSKLDFLYNYKATTLSIYKCQVNINSNVYNILFTDPNGSQNEKLADLRKHFYLYDNDVDCILLCFSLIDKVSFSNITKQWYPEIRQYFKEVPILLIGTHYDLKQEHKHFYKLESSQNGNNNSKAKLSSLLKLNNNNTDTIKRLVNTSSGGDISESYTAVDTIASSNSDNTLSLSSAEQRSCNIDLNNNNDTTPIKRKDYTKLCKLINAKKYLQSSCYDDKSVQKVMNCAIKYAYNHKREKNMHLLASKIFYLPILNTKEPQQEQQQSRSSRDTTYTNIPIYNDTNNPHSNKEKSILSTNGNSNSILRCFCCCNNKRSETCDSLNEVKL